LGFKVTGHSGRSGVHIGKILLMNFFVGILVVSGAVSLEAAGAGEQDSTFNSWIVLPAFFHTPETGTGGGIAGGYFYKNSVDARPSSTGWTAFYTEKEQIILGLASEHYFSTGSRRVIVSIGFRDFPDVFYGIGSRSKSEDEEDYSEKSFELEAIYEHELMPNLRIGPSLNFCRRHVTEVEDGGLLAGGTIRGVGKYRNTALGLVLVYDRRDNILYTMKGSFVEVSTNYSSKKLGSDYTYSRHSLDLRRFFRFGSRQAIGLRVHLSAVGGSPPFQCMSKLGGPELMRGFTEGRFRDKLAYTGQAEYRLKIWWRVGLTAFGALGDIAGEIDDFSSSKVKYSGGAGVRFRLNDEGFNLRLDLGFTDEGSGFYFLAGEAF